MKFILFTLVFLVSTHAVHAAFPMTSSAPHPANYIPGHVANEEIKHERSGVFGILSFIFALSPITSPLAIIFGIIGLGKRRKYRGLAQVGLIVGCVMFILTGFIVFMIYGIPYK